jgi:hypothetical protein
MAAPAARSSNNFSVEYSLLDRLSYTPTMRPGVRFQADGRVVIQHGHPPPAVWKQELTNGGSFELALRTLHRCQHHINQWVAGDSNHPAIDGDLRQKLAREYAKDGRLYEELVTQWQIGIEQEDKSASAGS